MLFCAKRAVILSDMYDLKPLHNKGWGHCAEVWEHGSWEMSADPWENEQPNGNNSSNTILKVTVIAVSLCPLL